MITIPSDHKNAKAAQAAQDQMYEAGVDPATIAFIVSQILMYGPKIAQAIGKLFRFREKA